MEVFVARQPIFNRDQEIVGYELLYRKDSLTNVCTHINGDQATAEVIINSFLNIGLNRLTDGKTCFIHFTEKLLEQKLPTYFSPTEIVVKISHNVKLSKELIAICKELKEKNYTIEIKECLFNEESPYLEQLLPYVDLIRVDYRQHLCDQRAKIEMIAKSHHIMLIAEKIETKEAYVNALMRGYELFQGFFFSKPLIESAYEIPTVFSSYYNKIQNMTLEELDVDELAELIEPDLSLSIKLLRLINTTSIGEGKKICSVREAILLLGVDEIQKWVHVLAVRGPGEFQSLLSNQVLRLSLTRAKLCETIAKLIGCKQIRKFYMTGLISSMEKIVSHSMEEILADLPLKEDIRDALMGKENILKEVLDLVEAVEQAKWTEINEKCKQLNINERELFRIYAESLNWTTELIESEMIAISESEQLILH